MSHSIPSILRDPSMNGKWRGILFSVCLFKAQIAGEQYYFCIDARDSSRVDSGMGYHLPLLEKVRYYFKVNYNSEAIENDPRLKKFRDKIIPAYPNCPLRIPHFYQLLPRITPCKAVDWTLPNVRNRLKRLYSMLSLEKFRKLRGIERDLDVYFALTHYGQSHGNSNQTRYEIIRGLKEHPGINGIVGFFCESELPALYDGLQLDDARQEDYLSTLARGKIGIYVRGPHECISFKFLELLALGKPIVGQKILNNQDLFYSNEHFDEQFCFEEPGEIVERVAELLAKPEQLAILGESNARVFDTRFVPESCVADILEKQFNNLTS